MADDRENEPQALSIGVVPRPSLPAAPGNEQMFEELYARAEPLGLDHASRFLSEGEAKDVVDDAFMEIWERWLHLPPEKRSVAYCLGAIHHHMLKRLRENKRMVGLDDAEAELSQLAIHEIDAAAPVNSAAELMDLAVAAMPPRRRQLFLMVRELGYTYKEAGELLSMSEGTVNTHMRLASEDVRRAVERHGVRLGVGRTHRLTSGAGAEGSNV